MSKFRIYVGALDGSNVCTESNDKAELVRLYESFSAKHEVVTVTLLDENGKNLNNDLLGHASSNSLQD